MAGVSAVAAAGGCVRPIVGAGGLTSYWTLAPSAGLQLPLAWANPMVRPGGLYSTVHLFVDWMMVLSHVPDAMEVERHAEDVQAHRMRFVLNRLVAAAKQQPEAQTQPEVEALGPLQLGPFAGRAYLTPVQAMQLQRAETAEAA